MFLFVHTISAVPHIASFFIGAIMRAIDPDMSVDEAAHLLKQTMPKIIFAAPQKVALAEKVIERIGTTTQIVVFGETTQHTPFSEFIRPHPDENGFRQKEAKSMNELVGMPKGICYSHLNMLCLSKETTVSCRMASHNAASAYWITFYSFLHTSIEIGLKRILYPKFDFSDPWTMFYQPIDVVFLNPLKALQMISTKKTPKVNLMNVKCLILGGIHVSSQQLTEIKQTLPHTALMQSYGQSEVCKAVLGFEFTPDGVNLAKKNPCSVGTIREGFSYKIVDIETGAALGPNQVGELRIKSKAQCIGYFNRDSSECFDEDGWLKTGDLLYYDENLLFYLVDRIKDSFKFFNLHISPVEIEDVIMKLEPIEAVVVIGIPHKIEHNHPMAVVKLKPYARTISSEEIIKYVEEHLEDKKRLRGGVKFVDSFPKTVTGKVNRFKLKKIVLNNDV